MLMSQTEQGPGPQLAAIPRRDPGLIALPILGVLSIALVLIRPSLVAVPLATACVLGAAAFAACLEARAVSVSFPLLAACSCAVVIVSVARPALWLVSIVAALFAIAVWAMPRLKEGGVSDSVFASLLGFALLGIAPSHLGLSAISVFAGGESMGKALVVVTLIVTAATMSAAYAAATSFQQRSAGGPVAGGQIGADLAGLLAAVLTSLIASTIKRPQASALYYLFLAVAIAAAVALGRRLESVFVGGGTDPEEIVNPSKIGDAYSLRIMLPASLAFTASYYVGKLAFV
jgi:hypothetical protein